MVTDAQSVLVGALVALLAVWFTFRLTQAQAEKERREEFRTLLILLNWQIQKIAAQAVRKASPLELQMPAYGMLLAKGLFARLPTNLRDHLLCLEIGVEGANRANGLFWQLLFHMSPAMAGPALDALQADVEKHLVVVRREAAEVGAALDQLFERMHIESKPITYSATGTAAKVSEQESAGDKQSDKL